MASPCLAQGNKRNILEKKDREEYSYFWIIFNCRTAEFETRDNCERQLYELADTKYKLGFRQIKSLFIHDTTKWMVWTDGASRIFNIFDNDEKRDSKIPRGQPTIPCNIRKLNTDIFGHLKQIRQVFVYDTRGLSRCYHNFTKLYQFQQVYYNDFCNIHSTTMLPPHHLGLVRILNLREFIYIPLLLTLET